MPLATELLEILRCPKCRGKLEDQLEKEGGGLVCPACQLLYPVVDDVPSFLAEDARPLTRP
jgi:uncharacterized protein YbaR (Trm112 family)